MHFKTNDGKEVSASLGFLVVTPEFCTEEWGTLAGQPFFQRAMYDKDVTIVPVLVNNPRHMKEKIPLRIKCLRSVDFYNKDDIISQKTVDTFLKPAIKNRVNKEKEELRNHIYWLYWNVIAKLPEIKEYHYPWSYPQHKRSRMPSQDDSDYYSHSTYQSYSQQSSSPNGKGDQTTGQGFNSDSAYGSDERNSQWPESTGSAPCEYEDKTSLHSNQSADDMNDLPHAPSLNLRSLRESMSTVKSQKHKTHSPLHIDIGEQRSSNGTSSSQDETDVKRHFSHTTKPNTPKTTSSCSNSDFSIQNSTKSNALFNTKPSLEHRLPVAVEVECNNLLTLSSHNSSKNIPSTDIHDASKVPNSNLSSRSSSIDHRNRSNRRETTQTEFKQSPTPQPINVSNTLWNSHSITRSSDSSHTDGSVTDSKNIHRPAYIYGHPQPQLLHLQIDKLPSVDLTSRYMSTSEPPLNNSEMSRRSVSISFQPPPNSHEISIDSFPSEIEQTTTSFKTAPFPVRDITHYFRPSGDCIVAPSSGYWDSRRDASVKSHKHNTKSPLQMNNDEERPLNKTSSNYFNQSADQTDDLPHAPSLNIRSFFESVSSVKSNEQKARSPIHRDIGEQRTSNGTSSSQDETDVKRHFSYATYSSLSSHYSNINIPSTDFQDASEVPNANHSSKSSPLNQRNRSNRRETTQNEFKQSPTPQPINVSNTLWNFYTKNSSSDSSYQDGSLTDSKNIHQPLFNYGHPNPSFYTCILTNYHP
ncbi:dentin sialophosphoprotein-like [Magallana gigas]|uniref:dentin sialophosphoprotein-like n=1 Tax=Magallana gigas TaxID=29159 RepID=UPI00333F5A7F